MLSPARWSVARVLPLGVSGVLRTSECGCSNRRAGFGVPYPSMTSRRDPTAHVDTLRAVSDEEEMLDPLSTLRRRTIIRYMDRLPPTATVSITELARVCAVVETDEPISALARSDFRRAIQGLRQRDLTRLSLTGILETRDTEAIVRGEQFEKYAGILAAIDAQLR